jgi:hypothetical protein
MRCIWARLVTGMMPGMIGLVQPSAASSSTRATLEIYADLGLAAPG